MKKIKAVDLSKHKLEHLTELKTTYKYIKKEVRGWFKTSYVEERVVDKVIIETDWDLFEDVFINEDYIVSVKEYTDWPTFKFDAVIMTMSNNDKYFIKGTINEIFPEGLKK